VETSLDFLGVFSLTAEESLLEDSVFFFGVAFFLGESVELSSFDFEDFLGVVFFFFGDSSDLEDFDDFDFFLGEGASFFGVFLGVDVFLSSSLAFGDSLYRAGVAPGIRVPSSVSFLRLIRTWVE